jgi:hypothetical protein
MGTVDNNFTERALKMAAGQNVTKFNVFGGESLLAKRPFGLHVSEADSKEKPEVAKFGAELGAKAKAKTITASDLRGIYEQLEKLRAGG